MNKFENFKNMRFGMFIHWGLYSLHAGPYAEWSMHMEHIPAGKYNLLADQFLPPADFTPESWVIAAKNAGMKYLVFTTRHHDGFALHDSKINPFNSMNAPCHRDFVREYADACRKHNMGVGLYYSIGNWQYPAYHVGPKEDPEGWEEMVRTTHAELEELMSQYGKIDILWYDGCCGTGNVDADIYHRTKELNDMVRSYQPEILINDRSERPEDFITPEQSLHFPEKDVLWESCITMNAHWGYCKDDQEYKTPATILRCLLECAAHGGNLLLNIGPKPDGSIPEGSMERLTQISQWMQFAGQSVYGSVRSPMTEAQHAAGIVTETPDGDLYLHCFDRKQDFLRIDGIEHLGSALLTNNGTALNVSRIGNRSWEISGFPVSSEQTLPETILLKTSGVRGPYAQNLIREAPVKLEQGTTPILGLVADAAPGVLPEGRLITPPQLCGDAKADSQIFPGWGKPVVDGRTFSFIPEFTGWYNVEIGLIAGASGSITASNGTAWKVENPGVPDSLVYPEVRLEKGVKIEFILNADFPIEVYAVKLIPQWQGIGAEHWKIAGAFATGYVQWDPLASVPAAMAEPYQITADGVTRQDGTFRPWTDVKPTEKCSTCGIDFLNQTELGGRHVCFGKLELEAAEEVCVEAVIFSDWWAEVTLNGERVRRIGGPASEFSEFSTHFINLAALHLRKGKNEILVKNHCGCGGSNFQLFVNRS